MSSELAQLLQQAAPVPGSPLDPELLWSAGRARRQRHRRITQLAAAVVLVTAIGGTAAVIWPSTTNPQVATTDAAGGAAQGYGEGAPLTMSDPGDLVAMFDDANSSRPPASDPGPGAPVTDENAAMAYGPLPLPVTDLGTLRDRGFVEAATKVWRYEIAGLDTGWTSTRVTATRFESLAAFGDSAPWSAGPTDITVENYPTLLPSPDGVSWVCRGDWDASAQYYPGAQYGECNITIGDEIWISISSVHPGSNSEKIYELLGFWLETATE